MVRELRDHTELEIGKRADRQQDAVARQSLDQNRIFQRPHAMIDPFDTEHVDRLPDIIGRPFLSRMGEEMKACFAGAPEDILELARRMAALGVNRGRRRRSLNAMRQSLIERVRSASASSRWRRKHMIIVASMPKLSFA